MAIEILTENEIVAKAARKEARRIRVAAYNASPKARAARSAYAKTAVQKTAQAIYAATPTAKKARATKSATPEVRAKIAVYRATPKCRAAQSVYQKTLKYKESRAKWAAKPEVLARLIAYRLTPERKISRDSYKKTPKAKAVNLAYRKANSESVKAACHRRRARKLHATGTHTAADVARIGAAQGWHCGVCAKKCAKKFHIDHVMPLSKGGSNGPENLAVLCPTCNLQKGAKLPLDFARERGLLL